MLRKRWNSLILVSFLFSSIIPLTFAGVVEVGVKSWTKQLGTTVEDIGYGVATDSSGNIYVTGHTAGGIDGNTSVGDLDIFLVKYNSSGTKLWSKQFGSVSSDDGRSVVTDSSGNVYITGYVNSSFDGNVHAGSADAVLIKCDSSGNKLWSKQFGSVNIEFALDSAIDNSGNIYTVGVTTGNLDGYTNAGIVDIFIIKCDSAGTKLWTRQLGGANTDYAQAVAADNSGNIYVTGYTESGLDGNTNIGGADIFLIKYDSSGNKLWSRQTGTAKYDTSQGVAVDSSGNVYLTGWTYGDMDGNYGRSGANIILIKYNSAGTKLWTRQIGTGHSEGAFDVTTDNSGFIYITGTTYGGLDGNANAGDADIFLMKFNNSGDKLWTKQIGSNSTEYSYDVAVDNMNNFYLTGYTTGNLDGNTNSGVADMFLVKYSTGYTTAPVLDWTGELNYVADGLNPEIGTSTTVFTYRVKYTDSDNDAPISACPQLYVKEGTRIYGIGTMDYVSGSNNTGALYTISTLFPPSTAYAYYLEAYDIHGASASGTPTTVINAPLVVNTPPELLWTNQTNYVADGLNPETGTSTTTFTYRVEYLDIDNDAPASGYPKVHIKKGGIEISGSPFSLSYVFGTSYGTGEIYSYSKVLSDRSTDYTYYFEAYDVVNGTATGIPTTAIDAPDVFNNSPTLSWTNETNYLADGLNPEIGVSTTIFTFRIKYADADNDAPVSNYPKLHIKKGGTEISGSPFSMNTVDSTQYTVGRIFSYSTTLSTGTDYTYYFEAYDILNATATGSPVTAIDNPDVVNYSPILAWTGELNYTTTGVYPSTGDVTTTFTFRVKYTDAEIPAIGYPKIHIKKNGIEISSGPFTMSYISGSYLSEVNGAIYSYATTLAVGTDYTYYFEAYDILNATATGLPIIAIDAPDVFNNSPTLAWTGEANYVADGIDIESVNWGTGIVISTFTYRVKYADIDNDTPITGYPKLHIKKGGTEIFGSPWTMVAVDVNLLSVGRVYESKINLATAGVDYTYYFEAYDIYGATASGAPTTTIDAPDIFNSSPTLTWTGETNYVSDGLNPEIGTSTTTFTFRVKYTDIDNIAPKNNYPQLHIKNGGVEISSSPFTMTAVDSSLYTAGRVYEYSIKLATIGTDYTYYFEAYDVYGATASGSPVTAVDGPDILNSLPILDTTGEPDYVSDGLNPETGITTTSFVYRIKYIDADNDAPAAGYPQVHIKKNGIEIFGSPFVMNTIDQTPYTEGKIFSYSTTLSTGTNYTYYFEAYDIRNGTATGALTNSTTGPNVIECYLKGYVRNNNGIGLSGITVSLSGVVTAVVTTNTTGYYEFLMLPQGNYSLTLSNVVYYNFVPTSYTYTNLTINQDNQNFVGTLKTFYISGYIQKSNNKSLSGFTVTLSGTTTYIYTTVDSGYFEFVNLIVGDYVVTPAKDNFGFDPPSRAYNPLLSNQDNCNFTATRTVIIDTVEPPAFNLGYTDAVKKKIRELKQKVEKNQ